MKKYLNLSVGYAIAALAGGIFYREFTKWNGYNGITALGKVHTHLFLLGMIIFLITALFTIHTNVENQKLFRIFMKVYNVGVPLTAIMLVIRGIPQVLGTALSSGVNAAISGMAGIGHILTGAGLILFLLSLKKSSGK